MLDSSMNFKSFSHAFSGLSGSSSAPEADSFEDAVEAVLHPDAAEDGGIRCSDKKLVADQRK